MEIKEVVDAKTKRFDEDAAWALLKTAETVTVAKGKKIQTFATNAGEKAAILQQAMGPSGNLRAPTFRIGDQIIIGYNADLYDDRVK